MPGAGTMGTAASPPAPTWEQVLVELESRLAQWRAALDGDGPYPDEYQWPQALGRCPDHLADRARMLNAAQQDLYGRLAVRRDALAVLLRSDSHSDRPGAAPLFVDQRT